MAQPDVFFGADRMGAAILERPFHGCMDHLMLNKAFLPTSTGRTSAVARLENRSKVRKKEGGKLAHCLTNPSDHISNELLEHFVFLL